MEIVTQPRVYLVGRTTIDTEMVQEFLDENSTSWITDTDNGAELVCEMAGRLCYLSFGEKQGRKSNRDYLMNIIQLEHGSVLEHASWNFIVAGVSRSFSHELVRHRAGFGYSQVSQRYVDESDTDFVEPDIIAKVPELHQVWLESVHQSHAAYVRLAEGLMEYIERDLSYLRPRDRRKRAREAARSVLPNATETKIFMTANARALRHFIEYRGAPDAEPEIRKVAACLLEVMQREAPNLFGDYTMQELPDGSKAAATDYKKV